MSLRDRVRAALARDGDADPQARDEEFSAFATSVDVDRSEPDRGSIDDWTTEYEENPLIRVPTQVFTSDILEPGVRVDLDTTDDDTPPEVSGYTDTSYNGLDLDDALEKWLTECGIVDGEFGRDVGDVLEKLIKDLVARRGTGMIEKVYDDAAEQNRIMGLRPFKTETVTAYTREGKNILLRPDDDAEDVDFDSGRLPADATTSGEAGGDRSSLPETPAGQTACYIQFDHTYQGWDDDEVRFSQDDVIKLAYDADTGEIYGTPAAASVYDRANSLRQQYKDLDQALKAVAYSHFVAKVETSDQDEAEKLLEGFDPSNPEKINVVNYQVEVDHHSGEIPDVTSTLKQEIEYVLSAFPVPIYRIGFEGEINRDVTSEQSDDYQRELSDWRDDIADALREVLQAKAEEFVDNPPDVEPVIAPRDTENPLEDDSFDADEFASLMQGVAAATGPGESPRDILPPRTVIETFLGLDADDVLNDGPADDAAGLQPLDEADPRVQETFRDVYAQLAAFSEGDEVDTPDGVGVVVEIRTEMFEGPDGDDVDASEDDPAYLVATEDGAAVYRESALEDGEIDVGMDDPEAALALDIGCEESALLQDGHFSWPESWQDADQPARLIALKAWAGLGGRFTTCRREMAGEIASPARFCAAFKDRILGWEGWRQGG